MPKSKPRSKPSRVLSIEGPPGDRRVRLKNPFMPGVGIPAPHPAKITISVIAQNPPIAVCPYCLAKQDARKMSSHMISEHSAHYADWCASQGLPRQVVCPYCRAPIRQNRLTKHIERVHPGQPVPIFASPTAPTPEWLEQVKDIQE